MRKFFAWLFVRWELRNLRSQLVLQRKFTVRLMRDAADSKAGEEYYRALISRAEKREIELRRDVRFALPKGVKG